MKSAFFCIFLRKNLAVSEIYCTFVAGFMKTICKTVKISLQSIPEATRFADNFNTQYHDFISRQRLDQNALVPDGRKRTNFRVFY